jgi:hypothetical protein
MACQEGMSGRRIAACLGGRELSRRSVLVSGANEENFALDLVRDVAAVRHRRDHKSTPASTAPIMPRTRPSHSCRKLWGKAASAPFGMMANQMQRRFGVPSAKRRDNGGYYARLQ